MLYSRYIESRLFLSSLNAMHSFVRLVCSGGLADERWPLRTAYLAAFTSSRTFDSKSMDRIADLVAQQLSIRQGSLNWWDNFCVDYVMAAARLDDPRILTSYFDDPGYCGSVAAVRTASLAYYLNNRTLLAQSTERVKAEPRHVFAWEAENAEALHCVLRGSAPDLPRLCRSLKEADQEHTQYSAMDLNLLLRQMHPGVLVDAA